MNYAAEQIVTGFVMLYGSDVTSKPAIYSYFHFFHFFYTSVTVR